MSNKIWISAVTVCMVIFLAACGSNNSTNSNPTNSNTTDGNATNSNAKPGTNEPAENAPANEADAPTVTPKPKIETKPLSKAEQTQFFEYATKLQGNQYIKAASIKKGNQVNIAYFTDFAEFKAANADTKLKESDYKSYWSSGDAINKTLMEESTKLFKQFPGIQIVKIIIPFQGKTHTLNVFKSNLEQYFGVDFAELNKDKSGDKWKSEVADKYFTSEERAKFATKFIQTV